VPCDEISQVKALEIELDELCNFWNAYKAASPGQFSQIDAARWVLESVAALRQAAAFDVLDPLRPAFGWVLEPTNPAKRGRRATALAWAIFGAGVFKDACGRPCATFGAVATCQAVDEKTVREDAAKIPGIDSFSFKRRSVI
jgi:hypothetical protein